MTNPYLTGVLVYAVPTLAVGGGAEGVAEIRIPGHHPALIDAVTFADLQHRVRLQARTPVDPGVAQERRRQRRQAQRRATRLPASGDLLAAVRPSTRPVHGAVPPDLLRCDHCGGPMYASLQTVGGVDKRRQVAVYLCRYHKDRGAAFCPQPPVRCEVVDDSVFAALVAWWREDETAPGGMAAGQGGQVAVADQPLLPAATATATSAATASAELVAAEGVRDRLRAALAVAPTGGVADRLRGRLAESERAVAQLMTQAQRAQAQRVEPQGPAWDLRRRPLATWESLDVADRRTAFSTLVAGVRVRDKAVVGVTARDAAGVAMAVTLSPAGVRNHLTALHRALAPAISAGVVLVSVFQQVTLPRIVARPPRHLDRAQRAAVLAAAAARGRDVHLLFALGLYAGLRRAELLALHWTDIDLAAGVLVVRSAADGTFTTKSGRSRTVPLCAPLADLLARERPADGAGFVLKPDQPPRRGLRWAFAKSFARVADQAGVPWLAPHDLRRTFATLAVQGGISIWKVKTWLGHTTVSVTERYTGETSAFDPEVHRLG